MKSSVGCNGALLVIQQKEIQALVQGVEQLPEQLAAGLLRINR